MKKPARTILDMSKAEYRRHHQKAIRASMEDFKGFSDRILREAIEEFGCEEKVFRGKPIKSVDGVQLVARYVVTFFSEHENVTADDVFHALDKHGIDAKRVTLERA